MPRTLILNQANIVANSGNSTFLYQFPLGGIEFKGEFIAVEELKTLMNSIKSIPGVQLVKEMTNEKIKNKQYLIF